MDISNTCGNNSVKCLHLATPYAIISMCHKSRKDGSHDSDRRNVSDIWRGRTTPSLIRGNSTQTLTAKEDTRLQSWELLAHQSVRVGAIHRGTKEKVVSQEAQNVRSLLSNLSAKLLDNRPGKALPRFYLIGQAPLCQLYDINQHKTTLVNIVIGIEGGKCVVL